MTERIFIAVPLQKAVQSALNLWSHQLQAQIFFQKRTYLQDYHITLKFLGDVDSAMIPAISGTLQKIAEQNCSFPIQVNSIGTFGTETAPRILFAKVESDLGLLEQLQNQVEQAML
ncbi:MAG: 2'-5' RNA ligase, partial [Paenibacillus sp. RIFOXYA1_FULL_44_5]